MGKLNRSRETKYSSGNEALRTENKLLKRQLKQLRKQATRTPDTVDTVYSDEDDIEDIVAKQDIIRCIKCNSKDVKSVSIPTGMITVCKDCSHRWKSQ